MTQAQQITEAPPDFPGTFPEYLCFRELTRLDKVEGVDYTFQTSLLGGRQQAGGLVVDFIFSNPPDLAISILGIYFHYVLRNGSEGRDLMTRQILAQRGITLIFIDDSEEYHLNPRFFVSEALEYRDHSAVGSGRTPRV